MHILILGGTSFVGRAAALEALSRGHSVTVFNRGTRPPPPGASQLIGDRTQPGGHAGLAGHTFDSVLDTWSTDPSAVRDAVKVLRGNIQQYIYVSTLSVYDSGHLEKCGGKLSEKTPILDPAASTTDKYSSDKRYGELAALKAGVPVLILRPGLILGPQEQPGRLPWWLQRLQRGGKTLAPGPKELGLQYVEARDFAAFIIDGAERKREGIYNCTSKAGHTTMGQLLEEANVAVGGKAKLIWADPKAILAAGITPWMELPIWLPPGQDHDFIMGGDVSKATGAGLTTRPMSETVRDTWAWLKSGEDPRPISKMIGLDPEKEAAFLEKLGL